MATPNDTRPQESATTGDEIAGESRTDEVDEHDCGDPHCGEHPQALPFRREAPKTGRNDPCPCGSGKKFKKCCIE